MKLGDIITLAKSGFTVADIKELMQMQIEPDTPAPDQTPAPAPAPQPVPDATPASMDSLTSEGEGTQLSTPSLKEESNSGEEIQKLKDELQKTKADLETAQKMNAHTDMSPKIQESDPLADLVRDYM